MNIQISQISNGWVITVAHRTKGQYAIYCEIFRDVVEHLAELDKEMQSVPSNVVPMTGTTPEPSK